MATRDYTLNYIVDTSQAGGLAQIRGDLVGIGNEAGKAAAEVNRLDAQLTTLAQTATAGTWNINVMGGAAKGAGQAFAALRLDALAMGAAMIGLQKGVEVLDDLRQKAADVRQHMRELADDTAKLYRDYREVANLKNQTGGDEVTAGGVEFGLKAGMTGTQAARFLEQFYGSSPAGLQKGNVGDGRRQGEAQEDYEARVAPITQAIAEEGARFGQRVKLETKTSGDLAGAMSQYGRVKDRKDAAEKLARIAYGLNEGRGNLEPLMKSLLNTAGSIVEEFGGPVGSLEELSVIQGVLSTHHSTQAAGTFTRQAVTALRDVNGPARDALAEMGIDGTEDHRTAFAKLKKALDQKVKEGVAPDVALMGMGFSSERGMRGLLEEYKDDEVIRQRLANQQKITGERSMQMNDRFFKREVAGISMQQDAQKAATDFLKGRQNLELNMGLIAATNRMRADGTLNSAEQQVADKILDIGNYFTPQVDIPRNMDVRVARNAVAALGVAAENAGLGDRVAAYRKELDAAPDAGAQLPILRRMFDDLAPAIRERDGQPFGGDGGVAKEIHQLARPEAVKKAKAEMNLPHPAAGPPAPARPMKPPAGIDPKKPFNEMQMNRPGPLAALDAQGLGNPQGGRPGEDVGQTNALLAELVRIMRDQTGGFDLPAGSSPFGPGRA